MTTEGGQKNQTTLNISGPHYLPADTLLLFAAAGTNSQITDTYYDKPIPTVAGNANGIATLPGQSYLRKRVAASTYTETQGSPALRATYYNYDLDGNVKTIWQQIDGLYINSTNSGLKRIDYEYDLISGKVNFVRYQDTQPDAFYYSYNYDADNRLTQAWSSPTAMGDTTAGSYMPKSARRMDAAYFYYLHGPLRRIVLGNDSAATAGNNNAGVQGIDYAYTLQGWLKGVNSTAVTATADMGLDGSDVSHKVAKDAYGYNLYYYNTDYKPIVTTNIPFSTTLQTDGLLRQLYNGNIAGSSVNIPQLTAGAYWIDRLYTYDQLNRIKTTTAYHTVTTPVHNGDYDEQFTYDGNGNILTVKRAGSGTGTLKDSVIYNYNRNSGARLLNNQLNYLNGHALASNITPDQALNNYTYDQIGNLTADVQAGITAIGWTVYGKILNINKASGNITYTYNPAGERVSKTAAGLTTWYIRDAQGNTLAVYDNKSSAVNWREQHLYGSSRLGMWTPNVNLATNNAIAVWDTVGRKQYELNNHLGNVLETITDKRIQHTTNGTSIDYYVADVTTAQDYYSFGSLMPGRQYNFVANNYYRYGFNGKENDNDVGKGIGNEQDYGMRIYDARVGRFLSVDPLAKNYPWYTPYQFAGNSPIFNVDLDGKEPAPSKAGTSEGQTKIIPQTIEVNRYSVTIKTQWFWHNGSGKYKTTAGWYTAFQYKGILTRFEKNYFTSKGEIIPYLTIGKLNPDAFTLGREVLQERYDEANKNEVFANGVVNPHHPYLEPVYIEFDAFLMYFAPEMRGAKTVLEDEELPLQVHHFATNINRVYTPQMEEIAQKFGLNLSESWNTKLLPHLGRHPNAYHNFVLESMQKAEAQANGSTEKFLELFEEYVKKPVIENPKLLRKAGWQK